MKKANLAFSVKMIELMLDYFEKQVEVLKELDVLLEDSKHSRLTNIHPLLLVSVHTAESMIVLVRKQYANEVIVVARSFIERIINICYLLVCDDIDFNNHVDYSMQKAYRTFCRKVDTISSLGIKIVIPEPKGQLLQALEKYTRKSGKEIYRWTELSFSERLGFVQEKTGTLFEAFTVSSCKNIYEDASEISHGSLYGALFIIGIFQGADSSEAVAQSINYYLSIVFFVCGLLINNLLQVIKDYKLFEVESLLAKSKRNGSIAADAIKAAAG